jgi:uncharacterized protein (DUF2132 family)
MRFMRDRDGEWILDEHGRKLSDLHGVTLAQIVAYLVEHIGFPRLAARVPVRCFTLDPSIASSLTFLRRTPWARTKVEQLYIEVRAAELSKPVR